jgi:hypothetical protein
MTARTRSIDSARLLAERVDALQEQARAGTFVSAGKAGVAA